jgi:hypothetical protein
VARHGSHRHCCVDGWLAEKVQTQLGILVVPIKQRALDRVGLARRRLRTHRSLGLPCVPEHPRRDEESNSGNSMTTNKGGEVMQLKLKPRFLCRWNGEGPFVDGTEYAAVAREDERVDDRHDAKFRRAFE